jgi:hypothetical protein
LPELTELLHEMEIAVGIEDYLSINVLIEIACAVLNAIESDRPRGWYRE